MASAPELGHRLDGEHGEHEGTAPSSAAARSTEARAASKASTRATRATTSPEARGERAGAGHRLDGEHDVHHVAGGERAGGERSGAGHRLDGEHEDDRAVHSGAGGEHDVHHDPLDALPRVSRTRPRGITA